MSALLLFDKKPENCIDCPISKLEIDGTGTCENTDGKIEYEGTPDFCEIKDLPGQKTIRPIDSKEVVAYKTGWNDCLKMIGGQNE